MDKDKQEFMEKFGYIKKALESSREINWDAGEIFWQVYAWHLSKLEEEKIKMVSQIEEIVNIGVESRSIVEDIFVWVCIYRGYLEKEQKPKQQQQIDKIKAIIANQDE